MHELISSVSATLYHGIFSWPADFSMSSLKSKKIQSNLILINGVSKHSTILILFYTLHLCISPRPHLRCGLFCKNADCGKFTRGGSQRSSGLQAKQLPAASADIGHVDAQVPGHDVTTASAALLGDSLVQLAAP